MGVKRPMRKHDRRVLLFNQVFYFIYPFIVDNTVSIDLPGKNGFCPQYFRARNSFFGPDGGSLTMCFPCYACFSACKINNGNLPSSLYQFSQSAATAALRIIGMSTHTYYFIIFSVVCRCSLGKR